MWHQYKKVAPFLLLIVITILSIVIGHIAYVSYNTQIGRTRYAISPSGKFTARFFRKTSPKLWGIGEQARFVFMVYPTKDKRHPTKVNAIFEFEYKVPVYKTCLGDELKWTIIRKPRLKGYCNDADCNSDRTCKTDECRNNYDAHHITFVCGPTIIFQESTQLFGKSTPTDN